MALEQVQLVSERYANRSGTHTGTRVYAVRFDDLTFTQSDIFTADDGTTAIPGTGDDWDGSSPASVVGRSYDSTDDQLQVTVTIEYSSSSDKQREAIENPLSRPTVYGYGENGVSEPYFRDVDDLPVVNSAGYEFADMPVRDRSIGTITATRNVASFDDAVAESYRDRINTSSVTINGVTYAARTLRIAGWSATGPHEENGTEFWTETIAIAKNAETHDHYFEDRGLDG